MSDSTSGTTGGGSGFGFFVLLMLAFLAATAIFAPRAPAPGPDIEAIAAAREANGGAMTREEIMARQEGMAVDTDFRRNFGDTEGGAAINAQLGTLGGASDAEMFRALRFNEADITVSSRAPASEVLIQDTGMAWLQFREGPLATWGGGAMLGMIGLLVLFYLFRGKIMIDGEKTGHTILRFAGIERFAHWLLAVSFILLGVTGLVSFFGRSLIIPLIGHEAFAPVAMFCKFVHNYVAWPFMLAVAMVFVLWVWHNIPNTTDLKWAAQGGGIFKKGVHPPAKKFNAGQKVIFWSVVLLGVSISLSGLSLLFPFELPMFAKTFVVLNQTGLPEALGFGVLPEVMPPHQEMQLAQAWHAIVAFVFMVIVIAHIYIGSVGMEGAFDAMGSGHVEAQWAKEHHSIWYEEQQDPLDHPVGKGGRTPAE
ncbi:MAG: formate dehydrogenase subunit gamma [Pseudomonadota bacterium]